MIELRHIGFIPDGNRRWAKLRGISITEAYRVGADKVENVIEWCFERDIKVVTVYVLSMENLLKRSSLELQVLFKLIKEKLRKLRTSSKVHDKKIHVKIIGARELLPRDVVNEIEITEKETKIYDKYYLNLAIAYSGRLEIINAVRSIIEDVVKRKLSPEILNEEVFTKYLYLGDIPYPYPDLIVRTGGEYRLSNFLLYEAAYSELVFLNKYWPEIEERDIDMIIQEYYRRERRYGR